MKLKSKNTVLADAAAIVTKRQQLALSQWQLARKAGVSSKTITNLENGRPVYASTLGAVATALGLDTAELLIGHRDSVVEISAHARTKIDRDVFFGNLPVSLNQGFIGRETEIDQLSFAWEQGRANVFVIEGFSGSGKTALVTQWLARLEQQCLPSCGFSWAFGDDGNGGNAGAFLENALSFYGDRDPHCGDLWSRGERLATLVSEQEGILILDGLDGLLSPPGSADEGRIVDDGIAALVRKLAAKNKGLCVITTRLAVNDFKQYAVESKQSIQFAQLGSLATLDAIELLKSLGVSGTHTELEDAVEAFGGHPLAITLIGNMVRECHWGEIAGFEGDEVLQKEEHEIVERVIAAYEAWFGDNEGSEPSNNRGSELLRLLGLLDAAADRETLRDLRSAPPIHGLTDGLQDLTEPEWRSLVRTLQRCGLVSSTEDKQICAHPLVRTYFSRLLRTEHTSAWKEGHKRVFESALKRMPQDPNSASDLRTWATIIKHACCAGMYSTALDIYKTFMKHRETVECDDIAALDLSALTGFFTSSSWIDRPAPVDALTKEQKGFVLDRAGLCLWSIGRLEIATSFLQASLEIAKECSDWAGAARCSHDWSRLQLSQGNISTAIHLASVAVEHAQKTDKQDLIARTSARLAFSYAQSGNSSDARRWFRRAIQAHEQDGKPGFLDGLDAYLYCDFLLDEGKLVDALEVADYMVARVKVSNGNDNRFARGIAQLSRGRAMHHQGKQSEQTARRELFAQAEGDLEDALETLVDYGTQHYVVRAHLAVAELALDQQEFGYCAEQVGAAEQIAERCKKPRHLADCWLLAARCNFLADRIEDAKDYAERAHSYIRQTGYCRRDGQVHDVLQQIITTTFGKNRKEGSVQNSTISSGDRNRKRHDQIQAGSQRNIGIFASDAQVIVTSEVTR